MGKYFVLLFLLFTMPSYAESSKLTPNNSSVNAYDADAENSKLTPNNSSVNAYDAESGVLRLNSVIDLQTGKKYTGVVAQINNASVVSENSTLPGLDEVATYDNTLKIITIPSLAYLQDGSQHYHIKAKVDSFGGVVAAVANTYDIKHGTLTLSILTDLQTATTYADVVVHVNNASVISEDLIEPGPNEVATYDNKLKIITIPSITYLQDGSQHYHLKVVADF
ncbi:MAG: hypothetical protein K9L22_00135 [Methylococcaceae bacterium]|nr:hypothetical protein [Methylococcaceae bacterium]